MVDVEHEGVKIRYNEPMDRWEVDDDEKEIKLSRSTLAEARKAITNKLRSKGTGRFKRFKAWTKGGWYSHRDKFMQVTVTSIVEDDGLYTKTHEAWISYPRQGKSRPQREKVAISSLYKDTARNKERIKRHNAIVTEAQKLEKKAKDIKEKMDVVVWKDEDNKDS